MRFLPFILGLTVLAALVGCSGTGGGSSSASHIYIGDGNPRVVRINNMTGAGWASYTGDSVTPFQDYIGDIQFDSQGNMYVADNQASKIWKFSAFGDVSGVSFGSNGSGTNQFGTVLQLAVTDSHIYILDHSNNRVVRIDDMTGAGWFTYDYGTGNGVGEFNYAFGFAVDSSNRIYIGDLTNCRIARIDDMAGSGWTTFGTSGFNAGEFDAIAEITILPGGKMLICDRGGRVIMTDNMSATNWVSFNEDTVQGACVDSAGRIYTVNQNDYKLRRRDSMTDASPVEFGSAGTGVNEFSSPSCVRIGP